MRIALAISVILLHCVPVAHGFYWYAFHESFWFPAYAAILPMFFGLSGFLVTGSAVRLQSLKKFFANRILRIIPALVVEVSLSALILGALVTTLNLREYFTSSGFWSYFLNIIGIIHFELPGVFKDNPYPGTVNGNLWTLHPEYYSYLLIGALMLCKVVYHRGLYVALAGAAIIGLIGLDWITQFGKPVYAYSGNALIISFLIGSWLFQAARYIPIRPDFAVIAGIAYAFMCLKPGMAIAALVPLMYLTVYLGMTPLPKLGFLSRGDYSYGIYLYGFPIQQTLAYAFPQLHVWWKMALVAIPLTIAFAMFSWRYVEKPALRLKQHF
nr:acyltransferase [Lampropedia puyangensis]